MAGNAFPGLSPLIGQILFGGGISPLKTPQFGTPPFFPGNPGATPPIAPSSGIPGAPTGFFDKADQFLSGPSGNFLMNLLAQEGFSTTPQSPLAAIGRAGLMTAQQRREAQMSDLQRRLVEAKIDALGSGGGGGRLIGVANPSDFEPTSLAEYQRTGDPGVLVPRSNTFGRYNPRDYTTDSWAKFMETGDPAVLERTAPSQFRSTAGGGIVALNPLDPAGAQTVVSDEAGAQGAENLARSQARGRASGEAAGAILAKATNAEGVRSLLDLADPLIDVATGSGAGAAANKVRAFFGKSSTGQEAIAQLQVLQAGLILGMPRLEGPQSDKDRALYIEAAGQIGDPNVPNEIKKAAVKTIRAIQDKYVERAAEISSDDPLSALTPEQRQKYGLD